MDHRRSKQRDLDEGVVERVALEEEAGQQGQW